MRRLLLNALVVLSLLLFVAVVVLWVRSYLVSDKFDFGWEDQASKCATYVHAVSNRGSIRLERLDLLVKRWVQARVRITVRMPRPQRQWSRHETFAWPDTAYRWMVGFEWDDSTKTTPGYMFSDITLVERKRTVALPYWVPALAAGLLPAVRWRRHRRLRKRRQDGLCPACGYDLRATPDRCPECGRVAEGPVPSAPAGG